MIKNCINISVPTKGTHLLYANSTVFDTDFKLSVPTKGTHLLYMVDECYDIADRAFRPHEGDPSSLR